MDHPISLFMLAAWPDVASADLLQRLAVALAWLVSHLTAAFLAALSYRPPLWARIATPVALVALAVWFVRHMNRPAKLGRPSRPRLTRPVDQRRQDGER